MYQRLAGFEEVFRQSPEPPVILNDLDVSSEEGRLAFNNRLMMMYTEENLSNIPRCDCRKLQGGENYGDKCDVCGTLCVEEHNKPITINHWVRIPSGLGKFLDPVIWEMLDSYMTASQVSMLQYLCDSTMVLDESIFWVREIRVRNIPRGMENFYDNFDVIMEHVHDILKQKKKPDKRNEIRDMLKQNREILFTNVLPVPNKIVFSIENNEYGKFADPQITLAINAIRTVVSADDGKGLLRRKRSVPKKEQMVVEAMKDLGAFYRYFMKKVSGDKYGYFRKDFYGHRSHFSCRNVIVSMAARHRFDSIGMSWKPMVQLMKLHIMAKLSVGFNGRPPMSIKDQEELYLYACLNYDPYIDEIMESLIAEAPPISKIRSGTGIPCTVHRYPSLMRGSAQCLPITWYSKDPAINVIYLSLLDLAAWNADLILITQ